MKRYTQSELQKMYMDPSEELKDRIHQEISSLPIKEQEEKIVKKKLSFSFVTVIAILLILVAVAYAATEVYHRISVNWKGEIIEEQEVYNPEPTPTPQPVMNETEIRTKAEELLQTVTEDEYGTVSYTSVDGTNLGGSGRPRHKTLYSWEEFKQAMTNVNYLSLPVWIPDGYEFQNAILTLDCKADGEYKLLEERQEGTVTLKRYTVDDADSIITGYELFLRDSDEDYHYIVVYSNLYPDSDTDEHSIGLLEGENAVVVSIPGMDNALAIDGTNETKGNALLMRRTLDTPIEVKWPPFEDIPFDSLTFTEENIDIHAPLLDTDIIQKMFTPEE